MLENVCSARCFCFWDRSTLYKIGWIVFLLVAGFLLHLPSEIGMSLAIPPDSNEYAIGLANLFEHGKFGFTLNGDWYPSRYAPWFSLFCLAPAYFLFGGDVLSLHWAVLAYALSFLVVSYYFGRAIGLGHWSYACAAIPMFIPDFVFYSRMVMTEIPYTAIFAVSALAFVRFCCDERPSLAVCLGCGVLVAWSGAVRATALPMLSLFVLSAMLKPSGLLRRSFSVIALTLPASVYGSANLVYNRCVFGSFFRSGYNYWLPVPCDYPDIMFNVVNARLNISMYLQEPLTVVMLILAVAVAVAAVMTMAGLSGGSRKNRTFLLLTVYVLFQGLVLALLYVGYYWCDVRFFLPVALCLLPLALKAVVVFFGAGNRTILNFTLTMMVLSLVGCFRYVVPQYSKMTRSFPFRIVEAAISRAVLPNGAVVIQDGAPMLMDWFGPKDKNLEIIPVCRYMDHVNAMVAPVSVSEESPRPSSWQQVIIPELIASGRCRLPIAETLSENPDMVGQLLASGRRVFLHVGRTFREQKGMEDWELKLLSAYELVQFGALQNPARKPNRLRHLYDRFVFPSFDMDGLPEIRSIYYEVRPRSAATP